MNDEDCLRNIAAGGRLAQKAVGILYDRYARRFIGYLIRRRVSKEDAEDMVQDVFIKVVAGLSESSPEISNGRAYLYRALHNRLVDFLRAKKPVLSESDVGYSDDNEASSGFEAFEGESGLGEDETDFLLCFQNALREFYEQNTEAGTAIDLAVVEGFSGKELSEVLERSYGATREFLSQCKKKFQRHLKELCYDYIPDNFQVT